MHPREGGRKRPFAPMSRRDFLRNSSMAAASLPLASALLAACGTPTGTGQGQASVNPARPDSPQTLPINEALMIPDGAKAEAGPLEIYNWEEYINPRLMGFFEEQFGVKVNVNTFNTMDEAVATLTGTADSQYDVFVCDVDKLGRLADAGILRPLNHTYLDNLNGCWDRFKAGQTDAPFYDVGAHYSVPYTTYTTGVAWRIDNDGPSEDEVLSMANPWDILWDTRWAGKIHIIDDMRESIAMAMLREGITDLNTDDASTRAANLQTAKEGLLSLVDTVGVKADLSDYTDMPEGISTIHHGWSGDFLAARWYFPKGTEDRDVIRYWTPDQGGPIGNDTFTIPSTGKNPVLAHQFLNWILEYKNAMINFQFNGYLPPQSALKPTDVIVGSGYSYSLVFPGLLSAVSTAGEFANGTQLAGLTPEVEAQWQDVWEAFETA